MASEYTGYTKRRDVYNLVARKLQRTFFVNETKTREEKIEFQRVQVAEEHTHTHLISLTPR